MTLEEAVADLERGRVVVDCTIGPDSPTGEWFTELLVGCGLCDEIYLTEEAAVRGWYSRMSVIVTAFSGVIYWRIRPEVARKEHKWAIRIDHRLLGTEADVYEDKPIWAIYSRFLISDKPVLAEAA